MNTLNKLIFKESVVAIAFTTLCFLSLFFFFDLIEELPKVNNTYELSHAVTFVLLSAPLHLYELLPMTVLIGTIFVMSRLAQSSEFTILRTSGLTPFLALKTLLKLGALFTVITFAAGDYIAPFTDYYAQTIKLRDLGPSASDFGRSEAWLKDTSDGDKVFINSKGLNSEGIPYGIRVFQFNADGKWKSLLNAEKGVIQTENWTLINAQKYQPGPSADRDEIANIKTDTTEIKTEITSDMIASAIVKPAKMKTVELFRYIRHLSANGQTSLNFEIEFWKKIFYPLSCLVMVVLALPYAYLHFRSGNIATNVFAGVLIGISFFMLNNIFGHIGNMNNWTPWFAAAAPGLLYTLLSLGAFGWLILYR